jgi:2'-5' RNA ligase
MRLFVAIDLDEEIKNSIYRISERISGIKGLKVVEKENLHITLMFLGEVDEIKAEKVKSRLSEIEFEPFDIKFRGVGYFPPKKYPRVIWVGVDEGKERLAILANEVYQRLKKLGFKRDKDFAAHVTICRVKKRVDNIKNRLEDFENVEFGAMRVNEFKLKQSILKPTGPVYKDIETFRLG